MDDQKIIFSKNLQRIMEKKNKKQAEVADALGVSRAAFNMWYNGVTIPRMPKVQQLAKYFGVEVSELVDPPSDNIIESFRTISLPDPRNKNFVIDMEFMSRNMSVENMARIREYASFIKLKDDKEKKEGGEGHEKSGNI